MGSRTMIELSKGSILEILQKFQKLKYHPTLQVLNVEKRGFCEVSIELSDGLYRHKNIRIGSLMMPFFVDKMVHGNTGTGIRIPPKIKETGIIKLVEYRVKTIQGVKLLFIDNMNIIKNIFKDGQIGDPITLRTDGSLPEGASASESNKKSTQEDTPLHTPNNDTSDVNHNKQNNEERSSTSSNLDELLKRQAELTKALKDYKLGRAQNSEKAGYEDICNALRSRSASQPSPIKHPSKPSPIKHPSKPSPIKEMPKAPPVLQKIVIEDDGHEDDPKYKETKSRVENLRRVVALKKKKVESVRCETKSDKENFIKKIENITSKMEEESKCTICMELFGSTVLERVVQPTIISPCNHVICSKCYEDHANGIATNKWCPTCRKAIIKAFTLQNDNNLQQLGLIAFKEITSRG